MEGEVEYLSEWPPAPQGSACVVDASSSSVEISPPSSKRPKSKWDTPTESMTPFDSAPPTEAVDPATSMELEHRLTSEEMRIVHSHHSITADVLLARWWKTTSTLATDCASDEKIVSVIRSNVGPQSQLYNISR